MMSSTILYLLADPSVQGYLLFILIYLISTYKYLKIKIRDTHIKNRGISTSGTLIQRHLGWFNFYLTYTYAYQEKTYIRVQPVTREAYESVEERACVEVYYIPDDPQKALLAQFKAYYLINRVILAYSIIVLISILALIGLYVITIPVLPHNPI